MSKIKVTYVIGSLNVGGTQKHIYDLIRLIDRNRFDPQVIVFQEEGYYYQQLRKLKIPIVSLTIRSRWDLIRRFPSFLAYLRRKHPDILHVVLSLSSLYGCLVKHFQLGRKPAIVFSMRSMKLDLNWRRYLLYKHVLLKTPDLITAVSEPVRRRCLELGAEKTKVRLIRNGIGLVKEPKRGGLKQKLGIPDNSLLVGTVGSLTVRKNQQALLNMVSHIMKRLPNVRFVLLGEGSLRARLEKRCQELAIEEFVYMPGVLAPATDFLADLSVFVLTSSEEGTSNALLEAMAMGLPCVTSDIPSNRELLENGISGLLVNVEDAEEFSSAIIKVLTDKILREKLSKNAQEVMRTQWPLDKMVEENESLYCELASKNSTWHDSGPS